MENLFKSIIGEQLSSVEFVQDYVQLHFDGNILTLYSWPEAGTISEKYKFDDINYRNALCEIIGHIVNSVSLIDHDRLDLFFDGEYQISLSLLRNESNKNLYEFAYFVDTENRWFTLD